MSYITVPAPTPSEFASFSSETAKYRHITTPYCTGAGVDIASQGVTCVPWAISFDLPEPEFLHYSSGQPPKGPIHLRGHADNLPFESGSLDWLYSSHFLEDVFDWTPILREWVRVIRPGGHLIILVPDKALWKAALDRGQAPNNQHRHESYAGELSTYADAIGVDVIEDRLTAVTPEDYSVLFVGRKR